MRERPGQKIKLKTIDEMLGVVGEESAMEIEIEKIHPFRNHPFHVVDDAKMQDLIDSIRENGVLSPTLIRPVGNDEYEMVSGHRRMHAAMKLGMETIPAIIRDMTDDEAIVKMVDSNIQREELLPSEKAFAYKMKLEAMRRTAGRPSNNLSQNGTNFRVDQEIANQVNESRNQIRRYIR
ncbi:MAG: ParB/RepB/Spo0J family partition protein, partial [Lachnospiraceae bacterium]|nr:ParB/RepB/Spo0J family partition protein [Lachnospiraceae bacterium]